MILVQRFRLLAFMVLSSLLALAGAAPANAVTVQVIGPNQDGTFPGNDCSGLFGQGFQNCRIPADIDPDQSRIVIKYNFDDGVPGLVEINSSFFPTIDGNEFDLTFTDSGGVGATGSWTYAPGPGDPGITFWVGKGGPNFNLFTDDSGLPVTTGTWFTPLVGAGNPSALSHISFYDTVAVAVPSPLTLVLVGAGVLGMGLGAVAVASLKALLD
jgi:hypothetical protein